MSRISGKGVRSRFGFCRSDPGSVARPQTGEIRALVNILHLLDQAKLLILHGLWRADTRRLTTGLTFRLDQLGLGRPQQLGHQRLHVAVDRHLRVKLLDHLTGYLAQLVIAHLV